MGGGRMDGWMWDRKHGWKWMEMGEEGRWAWMVGEGWMDMGQVEEGWRRLEEGWSGWAWVEKVHTPAS